MTTGLNLVRVLFELEPDQWHGVATERLWAEPVGKGRFRLRNTPFFAFDVSYMDVVLGEVHEGQVVFAGVSLRGGHSTYRLKSRSGSTSAFARYWSPLRALGCSSYQQAQLVAVDVPPSVDLEAFYQQLDEGENAGVWRFEEGHCGHPVISRSAAHPSMRS